MTLTPDAAVTDLERRLADAGLQTRPTLEALWPQFCVWASGQVEGLDPEQDDDYVEFAAAFRPFQTEDGPGPALVISLKRHLYLADEEGELEERRSVSVLLSYSVKGGFERLVHASDGEAIESITSAAPPPREEWMKEVEASEIFGIAFAEPADDARMLHSSS